MQRVWASGISPTRACVVAALVVLPAACVWACEGLTVAMALFENRRDVHSLLVIGPENDPLTDADYERLRAWSSGTAEDLNLAIQRISTDDPAVVWSDHGFEQAPDTTRLTVLVARHPASALNLVVDRWDPAPTDEDLEVLRESPLRERLRIETIANLAVLVHAPGADAGTTAGIRSLLENLLQAWNTERNHTIALLEVNRADPRERTFMQFATLGELDSDWVGVFAGRGVMLFPPLTAGTLTRENINQLLERLAGPCTCIENPYALGVELPILWTGADEARAREFAAPLYIEHVVGPPLEASAAESETFAAPPVLALGGLVAGAMCMVSLGVAAATWWQYRRRTHIHREER